MRPQKRRLISDALACGCVTEFDTWFWSPKVRTFCDSHLALHFAQAFFIQKVVNQIEEWRL